MDKMNRPLDYNAVVGVSEAVFRDRATSCDAANLADSRKFTKSDDKDVARMERILDARPGTLSRCGDHFLERMECESCGRLLTVYDFIFTGLVDAGHSKSFILHTFVGTKFVVNEPRRVRCSACGSLSRRAGIY
jgi:hypothetical protein